MKHAPGPPPSSCLTCRQRRKKCDKGHPICARCSVGGFKCLGYEHIASGSTPSNLGAASSQLDLAPIHRSAVHKPKNALQRKHAIHTLGEEPRLYNHLLDESHAPILGIQGDCSDIAEELLNEPSSRLNLDSGYLPPSQIPPQPRGGTQNSHATGARPRSSGALPLVSSITLGALGLPSSDLPPPQSGPSRELVTLLPNPQRQQHGPSSGGVANHFMLPPRFYPDPVISGSTMKFILSLYEPLFELLAFKPVNLRCKFMRDRLVARIQASNLTHWSMYLGAKVFRTLLQGGEDVDIRAYDPWFERLDRLCITSSNDNILEDLTSRLSGALELSYLKFITGNTNAGYTLLKNIAPTFMKAAFADPTIWPRQPGSSGISLAHSFTSYNFDLGRFIFMDALSSLSFGVPPLIEYDTSAPATEIDRSVTQRIESIHGCTATFAISIIKINIWRAHDHNPPVKHSWQEIEADIWAWKPRPDDTPPGNSWKTVARLAIQEGWRHAALIYLYM
ncbi:hypothetical protein BDV93DRAFT_520964, partial [Ceratobasidium sp. AG-I]